MIFKLIIVAGPFIFLWTLQFLIKKKFLNDPKKKLNGLENN
jgi:hypothetical protein